jgi:hypothetical protein
LLEQRCDEATAAEQEAMPSIVALALDSGEHVISELDPTSRAPMRLRDRDDYRLPHLVVLSVLALLEAAMFHDDDIDAAQELVERDLVLSAPVIRPVMPASGSDDAGATGQRRGGSQLPRPRRGDRADVAAPGPTTR